MSPELEKLIEAYDAKLTCQPEEKPKCEGTFEQLLAEVLARRPSTGRDALMEAPEPLPNIPSCPA